MNPSTFTPLPSNISRKTWGCWRYLRIQQLFLVINYLRVFIVTFSWQQFADISLNAIGDTRISHLCNFSNWTIFFLKKKTAIMPMAIFTNPPKSFVVSDLNTKLCFRVRISPVTWVENAFLQFFCAGSVAFLESFVTKQFYQYNYAST